jgi:hypothetical protein
MHPEDTKVEIPVDNMTRKRPLLCSLILSMALTYFLVIFMIFTAALVFSGDIIRAISPYLSPGDFENRSVLLFALAGTFLFGGATTGILLFLFSRKTGFYLFFLTTLVIFILDVIFLDFDWMRYLILSGFIFILGTMHFSKRCYSR